MFIIIIVNNMVPTAMDATLHLHVHPLLQAGLAESNLGCGQMGSTVMGPLQKYGQFSKNCQTKNL